MASSSRLPSARRPPGIGGSARPMSMFAAPSDLSKQLQQMENASRGGVIEEPLSFGSRTTSKQSKRRSLLPQFSRKGSGEEKIFFPPTEEMREEDDGRTTGQSPGVEGDQRAMPPPAPPRTVSQMAIRPPGIGIPSRTTSLRPHTRTMSKDSNGQSGDPSKTSKLSSTTPKTESALTRTASTRLPQSPSKRNTQIITDTQSNNPTHSRSRTNSSTKSSSAPEIKRPSTSQAKPSSINTALPVRGPTQLSPTSPTSSTARLSKKSQLKAPERPAFSTYQQHYSPAKTSLPKPPVPTARGSSKTAVENTDVETSITFEILRDQIELLQLSLLHQSSFQTGVEFDESAKRQLGAKHAKLCKDYAIVREQEREQRQLANLVALEAWCPEPTLLAEHVQILTRIVSDLTSLTDPESRYSEVVDTFDDWMTAAEPILTDSPPRRSGFTDALSESWQAAHTAVTLKLRSIQRDLRMLPPCPLPNDSDHPSSLEILVRNCSSLADGMLKELDIMTKLEKGMLQQEKARINEQISVLLYRNEQNDATQDQWVPAWQSVA